MQAIHTLPFISFFSFVLGIFVLSKGIRLKPNLFFFILCVGLGLWGSGLYWMNVSTAFYWPDKITLFGGIFIVIGFYLFSCVFPNERKIHFKLLTPWRLSVYPRLIPAILVILLIPFNVFITGHDANGTPINGKMYPLLALTELGYILVAIKNYISQFRNSIGYKRQQLLYLFSGLALFLICGAIFDLILPQFGVFKLNFLGPLSGLVFLGFSTAGIISYSLMDIRLLFGKFILHIFSGAILTLLITQLRPEIMQILRQGRGSIILVMFYGLLAYFLIHGILNTLVNRFLLKKYRSSFESFKNLNHSLNNQLQVKEVVNIANKNLEKALGLKWIYFYDAETKKIIFDRNKHTTFPLNERQVFDEQLNNFAEQTKEAVFFSSSRFEAFRKKSHQPLALFPIRDNEYFCGYFLLGSQKGFNGLSAEQIRRAENAWLHIQTAYSRALLYRALEQKVAEQVKEITEANLKLQEETERRMEFLKAASHQLKTPITAMNSSLQLLSDTVKEGETKDLAQIAFNKSKNLASIVKGMLTLARVEKAHPSEFEEEVKISELFSEMKNAFENRAQSLEVQLDFSNAENISVIGNKTYLEQALFNLIENGLEHTGKNSIITVDFMSEPDFVILRTSDNGPGIAEEYKDQIFKKHIRSSSARGNGLGLYIVKAIVDAHSKAHIWFETEKGKGTIFYLRLRKF